MMKSCAFSPRGLSTSRLYPPNKFRLASVQLTKHCVRAPTRCRASAVNPPGTPGTQEMDMVDHDLKEYAEEAEGKESMADRKKVYEWFKAKLLVAQASCSGANDSSEDACRDLDKFKHMVHELASVSIPSMMDTLATLKHISEKPQGDSNALTKKVSEVEQQQVDEKHQRLVRLFEVLDKNKRGRLDIGQLQEAVISLTGRPLPDADLGEYISALEGQDVHFGLTEDECVAILSAAVDANAIHWSEGTEAHVLDQLLRKSLHKEVLSKKRAS